ncbi:MAG: transglycosylase SLT domain-containing protein [Burkholderiaceae bacterium]
MFSARFAVYSVAATLLLATSFAPEAQPRRAPTVAESASADEVFLAAREAARLGDRARLDALVPRLADHPLAAYAEFWQLQPRLKALEPGLETELKAYFSRYPNTYPADRLRFEWLIALGKAGDFNRFDHELAPLIWNSDDAQLRCYVQASKLRRAAPAAVPALAREARSLLANSSAAGSDGCMALTDTLLAAGQLSGWERVRALVEQNQWGAAKKLGAELKDKQGRPVDLKQLALAIDQPVRWLAAHERRLTQVQHELALVAIARLARDKPEDAARLGAAIERNLTPAQRGVMWGRIGHIAAVKLLPQAADWYRRGGEQVGVGPDSARVEEVLEWQVRAALRAGDWKMVKSAIERMPESLRHDPAWVYWLGRAYAQEGRRGEADGLWRSIASQFSFYGKLAAEEIGQPIVIPPKAASPSLDELAPMASNPGLARALKFYELGLRAEGHREWNWQLRGLNDRQLLAAAEYARNRSVLDRMINTSERTRSEFDFTQRFPSPHRTELTARATATGVDENWVYGLIRQESRFIQDARSVVGASGLMQLMPATAKYVARKLQVADFSPGRVNELDMNLLLGTGYLKMVLDSLDNQAVLATAAYNAGPSRARAWRASLAGPVEGAIFAETIPFNETRDYVKKVMSNSVYYAALANNKAQSLKTRLGTIAPKTAASSELP